MIEENGLTREHQEIVDGLSDGLRVLGYGMRRPQMISNELYRPDLTVTIDNKKFIPIEVINSQYGFDVLGMLSLVLVKDIVEYGVCIITDKLINQNKDKFEAVKKQIKLFRRYSSDLVGLLLLTESEAMPWFKNLIGEHPQWKPNNLLRHSGQ